MKLDPLVVVRDDLQPHDGKWFTAKQEPKDRPLFTTREVAVVFYGKGKGWLHLRLREDEDIAHEVEGFGIEVDDGGYRRLQLRDIEALCYVLLKYGKIDFRTFTNAIRILKSIADNYRLLIGDVYETHGSS